MVTNSAAEMGLIALALMDPDTVGRSQVKPKHFTLKLAQQVWEKALSLESQGYAFSAADLWSLLSPDDAGIVLSWGEEMGFGFGTATMVSHYDELIIDAYQRRMAMQLAGAMLTKAQDPATDTEQLRALAADFASSDDAISEQDTVSTRSMFDRVSGIIERFEERAASGHQLLWPWKSWNMIVGQMMPGMLYLLGAAESTGKTVAAENIADNLAQQGFRVAFFHLELSHDVMTMRQIARHSRVPVRAIEDATLSPEEKQKIADAADEIEAWPGEVEYVHSPQWTSAQIVRKVNALKPDVVIIDYMQKIHSTGVGNQASPDLLRWYPGMLEDIKGVAEHRGIPIILLTQLANEFKNKKPEAGAARWMKEAEEKANGVIYLWREIATTHEQNKDGIILAESGTRSMRTGAVVTKNTMGRQGDLAMLTLDGPSFRFVER